MERTPQLVIAVLCGGISLLLMTLSVAATTWLEADKQREGLWEICFWVNEKEVNCGKNDARSWVEICRTLCLVSMAICLSATILTVLGLRSSSSKWKYTFYRLATIAMFSAVICEVISLIVFPVMFLSEIEARVQVRWEFGWAYGIGWGAAIFMLGAAFLLLFDRETEELEIREKTYYKNDIESTDESP
ncbi:transmembrane protein 47-like isoform X2 [Liolophura sinensis]|uniref:transmembrane protein 47-like isoform X2 n=1 Tax=Liolophura sinensis TaxID=3198878 RepID=UPI0031585ECF